MADLNPDELFKQIRTAHRMVVSYYKRLFPVLQSTADQLGLEFYYWTPTRFSRPRGSTNILTGGNWEWDMAPGMIANFLFYNAKDSNKQNHGEWMLDFHVVTDTGVLKENMPSNQDPLELSVSVNDAKSVLRVYIFQPTKETFLNWYNGIWDSCDYPDLTEEPSSNVLDDENGIYGGGFEIPLADLVAEDAPDILIRKISVLHDVLAKK